MIVVVNRIPVTEEYKHDFEKRFESRARLVDQMPGFYKYEMLRPVQGEYYEVRTYWENMQSFEHWTESESFRRAHADRPPAEMFSGPNVLEIYEVVAVAERPAHATSD